MCLLENKSWACTEQIWIVKFPLHFEFPTVFRSQNKTFFQRVIYLLCQFSSQIISTFPKRVPSEVHASSIVTLGQFKHK